MKLQILCFQDGLRHGSTAPSHFFLYYQCWVVTRVGRKRGTLFGVLFLHTNSRLRVPPTSECSIVRIILEISSVPPYMGVQLPAIRLRRPSEYI